MGKAQREELETALRARVEAIFERCSTLCGFSIAERLVSEKPGARESELYVAALAAYPELGKDQYELFKGEISEVLADLLDQRPQAADLLTGRTFARVWH